MSMNPEENLLRPLGLWLARRRLAFWWWRVAYHKERQYYHRGAGFIAQEKADLAHANLWARLFTRRT